MDTQQPIPEPGVDTQSGPHRDLNNSDPTWLRTVAVGLGWIVAAVAFHLIFSVASNPQLSRHVSWLRGFLKFTPKPETTPNQ